jgi:hypothetical protein
MKYMALLTKPERHRFWNNLIQMLSFTVVLIIALLCNIEYESHSVIHNGSYSRTWNGPATGIFVRVIVCMVLTYRSFLAIQDFLIAKHYLASRITTTFDMLPWAVLVLTLIEFREAGDNWSFKWGGELKPWYFLAILVSVFVLQIYTLIRRVADRAKKDAL